MTRRDGISVRRTNRNSWIFAVSYLAVSLIFPWTAVADAVDFARDVLPILRRSCFDCHGPKKQEGDLRVDQRSSLVERSAVIPGDSDASELVRRISCDRGDPDAMPAVGEPLAPTDVALLRRWIQQGAPWPDDIDVHAHWAYRAPKRPPLPDVQDPHWPKTPIDWFVLARIEKEQLRPAPPASPDIFLRRLYLDLIGLPPSPAEVDAFVKDPSEQAVTRFVDDLLSRPQFGERWARGWLDAARYADSHGFQRDDLREIWAYRDWVIRAMNADMPFDQFTIEQIGGDLIPAATQSQKIATGFHRCAPTNVEAGSLPEETRVEQVIDRVNTTAAIWLGATLECAQCHDHKYDPLTQQDYYQLLAFFNNTEPEAELADPQKPSSIRFIGPSMPLSDQETTARQSKLESDLRQIQAQRTQRMRHLRSTLPEWADKLANSGSAASVEVLPIDAFESTGTTDSWKVLDDGSVQIAGKDPPDTDLYTIRTRTNLPEIRAFRVEAIADETLPGNGPGRGDAQRPNFVLNEIAFTQANPDNKDRTTPQELKIRSATASFSQSGWNVAGAFDGDLKTGWAIAPRFAESHWATLVLKEPFIPDGPAELTITLRQSFGAARTIGRLRLLALSGDFDAEPLPTDIRAILAEEPASWNADQRRRLLQFRAKQDDTLTGLNRRALKIDEQRKRLTPPETLVMVERTQPRDSYLFSRGDYRNRGPSVEPDVPAIWHPLPDGPKNRWTLGRWLVDPANPLVARVTVNRWWAEIFGTGIVETLEDFGIKGELPTHPDLLDWLAVEFIENGWSRKHILRTIVLSATYRQSSTTTPEILAQDDKNRLLARGPRFRMDAEMIRDNALAASGLLSLRQFGPSIRPFQPPGIWTKVGGQAYEYEVSPGDERYRRGIYVVIKRGSPYPSFTTFDAPPRSACVLRRSRTNTPLQALTLLNDPVYVEIADALAKRTIAEAPATDFYSRATYAFRLCTARTPTAREIEILHRLFQATQERFTEAATPSPSDVPQSEMDAWRAVATAILNLHETITKE